MSNPLSGFSTFLAAELSKAEAAIGPSLQSVGAMLAKVDAAVGQAIATSTNADQAIAIIDPIMTVLLGSLSGFLGTEAVSILEKYLIAGVNNFIRSELPPAPVAPANPVSPPSIVA